MLKAGLVLALVATTATATTRADDRCKSLADPPGPVALSVARVDTLLGIPDDPKAQAHFERERSVVDDKDPDHYFRLGMAASQLARTETDAKRRKAVLLVGVKAFHDLADNDAFKDYANLDVALFAWGYMLEQNQYRKEARDLFDRILKNFPTSAYVPRAHFVFGELYLEVGQAADAAPRYKLVMRYPQSPIAGYAAVRAGTNDLADDRVDDALALFTTVSNDGELLHVALGALETYADAKASAAAYRGLLALAPDDADACRWKAKLARAK